MPSSRRHYKNEITSKEQTHLSLDKENWWTQVNSLRDIPVNLRGAVSGAIYFFLRGEKPSPANELKVCDRDLKNLQKRITYIQFSHKEDKKYGLTKDKQDFLSLVDVN